MEAIAAATTLQAVVLQDRKIPPAILQIISFDTAKKYQIIAFEATDTALKLAIVHPEQLKQGFMVAITDLGKKMNKKIELYKTDAASLNYVLKQYGKGGEIVVPSAKSAKLEVAPPAGEMKKSEPPIKPVEKNEKGEKAEVVERVNAKQVEKSKVSRTPPLFIVGQTVAFNYMKRIPLEYAREHRVICVDFLKPNIYWFATDGTNEEEITKLIPLIAKENNIEIEKISLTPRDFDGLLRYYTLLLKQEQESIDAVRREAEGESLPKKAPVKEVVSALAPVKAEAVKPEPVKAELPPQPSPEVAEVPPAPPKEEVVVPQKITDAPVKEPAPTPAPVTQAAPAPTPKDPAVTEMDDHAEIVSSTEEKEGIAGFFQRMNASFGAGTSAAPKPEDDTSKIIPAIKPPKLVAPDTGVSSRSAATPAPMVQIAPTAPNGTALPAPAPAPATTPANALKSEDENGDIGKLLDHQIETLDGLKEIIKKGFIPQIVAGVVSYAIHEKASDVHIEAFDEEVRVRYRIDGQLLDIVKLPPDVHAAMVSRIKILSRLRLDETRVPQDGRFDVNFNNAQVDLRVSLMPTVHGEKVVMRILDKSRGVASLEKLGIEGLAYENLIKAVQKPFGICLATGPTGSGKSTSLYAILNRIATPNVNVVTLEDPVEYEMKGINQAQIRPKIGFTFAEGLRSILRQDPNIIMVGEIRDGETANMATQAALTGHLVLSTLHTNDAAGAIPRLTNMGIEPFLIASSLNVAMGQRLVRKICQNCKKDVSLPSGFKTQIEKDIEVIRGLNPADAARIKEPIHFYQGMGCEVCGGKGYTGRVGIYEVLVMSEELEDLTLQRASNEQIQQQAQKEGMLTMYQDGLIKVINGITTLDEVLRETSTK